MVENTQQREERIEMWWRGEQKKETKVKIPALFISSSMDSLQTIFKSQQRKLTCSQVVSLCSVLYLHHRSIDPCNTFYLRTVKSVDLCRFHYDKPLSHTHAHSCVKIKRVVFSRAATSFQYSHPASPSHSSLLVLLKFPGRFTNNSLTLFDAAAISQNVWPIKTTEHIVV